MFDNPEEVDRVTRSAKADSIVENFGIEGLYGYRHISLESSYAATILIAQNGSGKTTLLGVLDAFLKCQFTRLRDIKFETIYCKFRSSDNIVTLSRDNLDDYFEISAEAEFNRTARRYGVDAWQLFRFLIEEFTELRNDYGALSQNEIFAALRNSSSQRLADTISTCDKLLELTQTKNLRIFEIFGSIRSALGDTEIVYLPTYRRIELPLINEEKSGVAYRNHQNRPKKFRPSGNSLFVGDINFGLSDISARLEELNGTILAESGFGYREISANIIEELLNGTADLNNVSGKEIPDKDELNLFFARVKEGRYGPFVYGREPVPNIDKIYSGNVPAGANGFLLYFLSKLDTVIKSTRDRERQVEDFVNVCNKYLRFPDGSITLASDTDSREPSLAYDSKEIVLNRKNLRIHVVSLSAGRRMSIEVLSSGEKQMISLFARMYLYDRKKIVLIDEPELSLSLDWQRQILVDLLNAPLCRQVIAITHSPFVFDNPLEPFARALKLSQKAAGFSIDIEDGESEIVD